MGQGGGRVDRKRSARSLISCMYIFPSVLYELANSFTGLMYHMLVALGPYQLLTDNSFREF